LKEAKKKELLVGIGVPMGKKASRSCWRVLVAAVDLKKDLGVLWELWRQLPVPGFWTPNPRSQNLWESRVCSFFSSLSLSLFFFFLWHY
jgi:hypothetical protein